MGGAAGGVKYLVRNILFKLAIDGHKLFGEGKEAEEAAMKVAGKQTKGQSINQ